MLQQNFSSSNNQNQSSVVTTINKANTKRALVYLAFLSISIFLPRIIHQQAITGPVVNACLFLTATLFGSSPAMMLGLIPSTVALSSGLLPITLAPIVPFIILSNAILVMVFNKLAKKSFSIAVIASAITKFVFLYLVSQQLLANLLPGKFMTIASQMFSWPQLVTALAGGFIAFSILKIFQPHHN